MKTIIATTLIALAVAFASVSAVRYAQSQKKEGTFCIPFCSDNAVVAVQQKGRFHNE